MRELQWKYFNFIFLSENEILIWFPLIFAFAIILTRCNLCFFCLELTVLYPSLIIIQMVPRIGFSEWFLLICLQNYLHIGFGKAWKNIAVQIIKSFGVFLFVISPSCCVLVPVWIRSLYRRSKLSQANVLSADKS